MDIMSVLTAFTKWIHVFGGILWIGFLFFFGFVFTPAVAELGQEARGAVYGSIISRTTRWVRPATLLTYLTGLLLLGLVYHAGGLMFEPGHGWGPLPGVAALLPFLLFLPYDIAARSPRSAGLTVFGGSIMLLSIAYILFMTEIAGMTYRASMIHVGLFYGTVMAANVFMRVLPVQRRILAAIGERQAPDPADVAAAQVRARHNAYLSLPLVWTMLNQHTVVPGASSPLWFVGVLLVNHFFISYLYREPAPKA